MALLLLKVTGYSVLEICNESYVVVCNRFAAIHQEAPDYVDMSVEQEILETGIKVVDMLAPYAKGGKIGEIVLSRTYLWKPSFVVWFPVVSLLPGRLSEKLSLKNLLKCVFRGGGGGGGGWQLTRPDCQKYYFPNEKLHKKWWPVGIWQSYKAILVLSGEYSWARFQLYGYLN